MSWSPAERDAVLEVVRGLSMRVEVEAWLSRSYGAVGRESEHGVEYEGLGMRLRCRWGQGRLIAAVPLDP